MHTMYHRSSIVPTNLIIGISVAVIASLLLPFTVVAKQHADPLFESAVGQFRIRVGADHGPYIWTCASQTDRSCIVVVSAGGTGWSSLLETQTYLWLRIGPAHLFKLPVGILDILVSPLIVFYLIKLSSGGKDCFNPTG